MSQMGSFGPKGGPGLLTITGNSGGAVAGNASRNINLFGGSGVTVTGDPGANTLTITADASSITYKTVNSSPYVVLSTDEYLSVDSSGGAITLQFPNAAVQAKSFIVKDKSGSAATHNITITTVGGAVLIDGATSFVMNTNYESVNLMGSGSAYELF